MNWLAQLVFPPRSLHEAIERGDINYLRSNLENNNPNNQLGNQHSEENLEALLLFAVKNGKKGIDQFLVDRDKPLHAATKNDIEFQEEIVSILLAAGADVNTKEASGRTALHWASIDTLTGVVSVLLADFNTAINSKDTFGFTPLQYASRGIGDDAISIISSLIDAGADANVKDSSGRTPLFFSSEMGRANIVHALLKGGADVRAKADGMTPLHFAVNTGCKDTIRTLVEAGADPNDTDVRGQTALHYAVSKHKLRCFALAETRKDASSQNKGQAFVDSGCLENVALLLEAGADANVQDWNGKTPLYYAIEIPDKAAAVVMLIGSGAIPNLHDKFDMTPLHKAVQGRNKDAVSVLLEAGADTRAACSKNKTKTSLHFAAAAYYDTMFSNPNDNSSVEAKNDSEDIAAMLLGAGADVNAQDRLGDSPLHIAVYRDHLELVQMFLASGADINAKAADGMTPLHIAIDVRSSEAIVSTLLGTSGVDIDARDSKNKTPFHYAIISDDSDNRRWNGYWRPCGNTPASRRPFDAAIQKLLAAGADINIKDCDGNTPLHYALETRSVTLISTLLGTSGVDINAQNNEGITPIQNEFRATAFITNSTIDGKYICGNYRSRLAAFLQHKDIISLLLDAGADFTIKDQHGQAPIHNAFSYMLKEASNINEWEVRKTVVAGAVETVCNYASVLCRIVGSEECCSPDKKFVLMNEYKKLVLLLHERGADINSKDGSGNTLLHAVVKNDFMSFGCILREYMSLVALLLEEGEDINAKDGSGKTPLHCAVTSSYEYTKNTSCVFLIPSLKYSFEHRRQNPSKDIISMLLVAGAEVNAQDSHGKTGLHFSIDDDTERVTFAQQQLDVPDNDFDHPDTGAEKDYISVSLMLLEAGADVSIRDDWGKTPLHYAAQNGDCLSRIRILLDAGADVNAQDGDGTTPLHYACMTDCADVILCTLLISAGANVNAKSASNETPLHCCAGSRMTEAYYSDVVGILLAAGADVDAVDNGGRTPLHLAAGKGKMKMMTALISAGADINALDNYDRNPLHLAVIAPAAVCLLLLEAGVNFEAVDQGGSTALELCHREDVRTLLREAIADIDARRALLRNAASDC